MRPRCLVLAAVAILSSAAHSHGASVAFSRQIRPTTAAEIASDPSLAGKFVFGFHLTSATDIVSIDQVAITVDGSTDGSQLYQHFAGTDSEPPDPPFVVLFSALGADSWISTPGPTTISGGGFSTPGSTWSDTVNSGPATFFKFAQLTISGRFSGSLSGRVGVLSDDGMSVVYFPIIPEPASGVLAGTGLAALIAARRRRRTRS